MCNDTSMVEVFPTSMSMAKSKEIEVLLRMLHSWLRCVSLEVLDMLCVGIHITVRPHIGGGRGLSSYERCVVSHCLRWYHPPGVMMEQGKTAIPKPATSSVTRGREPGANLPRMDGWQGSACWFSLLGTANDIMGYQKRTPRLDYHPKENS